MSHRDRIEDYKAGLAEVLQRLDTAQVDRFIEVLSGALHDSRTVFIFGNGGSGATASHLACDLNKGVSYGQEVRFRIICLNDNLPTLMAYANDVSYDDVFVEPLKNFLRPGDVVIGLSGSGNSENVIRAIDYANAKGGLTVGLCGYSGGRLKEKAQLVVHVAVDDMQMAEDAHLIIGHMAMQALCGKGC
jgi:D-sedoheptulose 7-phosphate isomerase